VDEYPVKVGSMLFTMVEPHRGHEVAYNRWYERDHFYAGCMIGPWLFAGHRWVATRALKDLRFPDDSTVAVPVDAGSYLAIYWVHQDHHDEHFGWANQQVFRLYGDGRGFQERTHVHTVLFNFIGATYRDADPVPVELALDHPFAGLVTVFIDRNDGVGADELMDWLRDDGVPSVLGGAVALCSEWAPIPRDNDVTANAPMTLGSASGGEERTLQMFFLDADPATEWDRFVDYGKRLEQSALGHITLAAPFITTLPGTDTYVDQLW
jgi:hypothetical protein